MDPSLSKFSFAYAIKSKTAINVTSIRNISLWNAANFILILTMIINHAIESMHSM